MADIEFKDNKGSENPVLKAPVDTNTDLKELLVNYVGEKHNPEDERVTVEMIVDTMAREFPEFVLALAEENFVRGYHQALVDVDTGRELLEQHQNQEVEIEDDEG
jgi:hypothetical protein|tara:strand:- start:498 stop:812 length:315 start_codon:yes stop_codon:yes gene_type:complete